MKYPSTGVDVVVAGPSDEQEASDPVVRASDARTLGTLYYFGIECVIALCKTGKMLEEGKAYRGAPSASLEQTRRGVAPVAVGPRGSRGLGAPERGLHFFHVNLGAFLNNDVRRSSSLLHNKYFIWRCGPKSRS